MKYEFHIRCRYDIYIMGNEGKNRCCLYLCRRQYLSLEYSVPTVNNKTALCTTLERASDGFPSYMQIFNAVMQKEAVNTVNSSGCNIREDLSSSLRLTIWNVEPCRPVEISRRFRGAFCLHHEVMSGSKEH
jgi:hypothetical protein